MSERINKIGDEYVLILNSLNNYEFSGYLNAPIYGMKYFRVLSNIEALLYANFADSSYVLGEDGILVQAQQFLTGNEAVWYRCKSNSIDNPTVKLIQPSVSRATSINASYSFTFQFVTHIPDEYLYESA